MLRDLLYYLIKYDSYKQFPSKVVFEYRNITLILFRIKKKELYMGYKDRINPQINIIKKVISMGSISKKFNIYHSHY